MNKALIKYCTLYALVITEHNVNEWGLRNQGMFTFRIKYNAGSWWYTVLGGWIPINEADLIKYIHKYIEWL